MPEIPFGLPFRTRMVDGRMNSGSTVDEMIWPFIAVMKPVIMFSDPENTMSASSLAFSIHSPVGPAVICIVVPVFFS